MPDIIYYGFDVTITAVSGNDVTFELTSNQREYEVDWTATADVYTHSPTTVTKTVSSTGWLYLSAGYCGRNGISTAGAPKHPAVMGGVGAASWQPMEYVPVPVEIDEVTARVSVLRADGRLSRSAPIGAADFAGDLGPVGSTGTVAVSGRWLHAHGLLGAPDAALHERTVVHMGDEVGLRLAGTGKAVTVNLADPSRFAPHQSRRPGSPTDLVVEAGARGTLGVAPDWLYRTA